ncbi:MAG: cell wall hydrolase [bacterium]|nr:cell wall hydrolase [bacterium]
MKLVKEDYFNKIITEKYPYDFDLSEDGLYLFEVIASAKNWWQNLKSLKFRSLFKDDDISSVLDRLEITTSNSGDTDVRSAWNGNELKGLFKTVLIAIRLKQGKHILYLTPDQSPYLKSIKISQPEENNKLIYYPTDNNPAQAGSGRPWLSFVLINLTVQNLAISAKTSKSKRDDDDLKLIMDGDTQRNEDKKAHQDWYWCGKTSKGAEKKFTKPVGWNGGLHYLDLLADESPFLYYIELELAVNNKPRIPTADDPEWTGDFNDDSEQMILARVIWGEARSTSKTARIAVAWTIRNRLGMRKNWDTYHNIILDNNQYSCFWEKPPRDDNIKELRNPADGGKNIRDMEKWHETYEIAGQVIDGAVPDPTSGANHYYDDSVKKKYKWMTEGKFKIKIDNLNYIYLAK